MLRLVAHRGRVNDEPENTIAALRTVPPWVDAIEVDVRLTSDNVCILLHDKTLDRTTDGSGAVGDVTWSELGQVRVTGDGRVPRLARLLEEAKRTWLDVFVDVKPPTREAAQLTTKVVRASGMASRCILLFRNPKQLRWVRGQHPGLRVGVLGLREDTAETMTRLAQEVGAEVAFIAPGDEAYVRNRTAVDVALRAGIAVGASLVNDAAVISMATGDGCTTILTDRCQELHAWKATMVEQCDENQTAGPLVEPNRNLRATSSHA